MKNLTLRTVFIIPFVLQIILAIGAVGYFSWRNSQQAVNDVAVQLRSEVTARVIQQVQTYLEIPHTINQINANSLLHGDLSDVNAESEDYLWHQYQIFDMVTAIQFALPEGNEYLGIVKPGPDEPLRFQFRDETTGENLHFYSIGQDGHRAELQRIGDTVYDPRIRPWFQEAVALRDARWGPIEPAVTAKALAIDASQPTYDEDGNLLGVLLVDIFLEQIDEFLEEIQVGNSGLVYIMERSGQLVADSAHEPAFIIDQETQEPERINAVESSSPLIKNSAFILNQTFPSLNEIDTSHQVKFYIEGESHYLQVTPYVDERGLDWLIVVVIPENDFMAQIKANNRNTMFIIFLTLLTTIVVGILTTRWLTRPILQLNESAKALANGDWQQEVIVDRRDEIGELAQSFNVMASQLHNSIHLLEARIETQKQTESALRESEEKYRTLVETAEDGISLVNTQEEVLFYNQAYLKNIGYSTDDEVPHYSSILHPDDLTMLNQARRALLSDGSMSGEYRVRHKDGHWVYQLAKSVLIYDSQQQPEAILTITHDITRRKELEKQLQQQDRLAVVGRLAAGIAHDFNNILSSITLYADLLARLPNMPEKSEKYVSTITNQSHRAANLIQQILDFSRRSPLKNQIIDLLTLLQELIYLVERTFPQNISINLNHSAPQHLVYVDPTRMHQVFMNLMLNARDAMSEGGELSLTLQKIEVLPEAESKASKLSPGMWEQIKVQDTGIGISQNNLEHLFEPFFTTKGPGQGTGLGLAQVYGIVQQHEGIIEVISEQGVGTTFTLYLPTPKAGAVHLDGHLDDFEVPRGNQELILVVEDNEDTLIAIVNTLQSLNYSVAVAENGKEALDIITESPDDISLIISDMLMPVMNGGELLQILQEKAYQIPTIILSGYLPENELEGLRQYGLADWLTKPPTLDDLARTIARNKRE